MSTEPSPNKIVVGADDTIYVLDASVNIHVFSPDGEPLGTFVPGDSFWGLYTFDMAPDGTFWGVDGQGMVHHFDAEGTISSSFDLSATAVEEPHLIGIQILVGPDGNLYVLNPEDVDNTTTRGVLYVMTTEGEVLRSFELGMQRYGFSAAMDFGPDGNLYTVFTNNNTGITVYDTEGNVLREGVGQSVLSQSLIIGGLAVGADGSIYAAASGSPIYHLANDGTLLGTFGESYYNTVESGINDEPPFPAGTFATASAVGVFSNGDVVIADANGSWWQLVRISFSE